MTFVSRRGPALVAALLLLSCATAGGQGWTEVKVPAGGTRQLVEITGTVTHLDLEGGLYVIRDVDGTTYSPTNLPQGFRVDGMAVEAAAQRRDDLASIGQAGTMVDLLRIRERVK